MSADGTKGINRSAAISYQEVLDLDTREPPAIYREERVVDLGPDAVGIDRFISEDYYRQEIEQVWKKVWQWACREEDIPNPGDYTIYELDRLSVIIARQSDGSIRGFYNSCLHRGRKLVTQSGCKHAFRCAFHGFAWNLDGSFKENPIKWDFPQIDEAKFSLPEVKVAAWGGFVFINFDPDAPALESVLDPMPRHFERYDYADRYKWVHVSKVIKANWKVVSEAFMESHHSITTHPQILPYLADENSQYDVLSDHVTRHISAVCIPAPAVDDGRLTQQAILDAMMGAGGRGAVGENGAPQFKVPEGKTAREYAAELFRQMFKAEDGYDYSDTADAEILDTILYNVFPNMSFWAGYAPNIVYRWRPVGKDATIMDVIRLKRQPKDGPRHKPCAEHRLGEDEPWTAAAELASLGGIFEQDMANLPYVQEGLYASGSGVVHYGRYAEMRLKQQHVMLDRYMGKDAKPAAAGKKT